MKYVLVLWDNDEHEEIARITSGDYKLIQDVIDQIEQDESRWNRRCVKYKLSVIRGDGNAAESARRRSHTQSH